LGHHHAELVLHAKESAKHVGIEGGRVGISSLLDEWTRLALGAGTVDRYIEPAQTRDGLVDEMAHLILAPYVGFDEGSLRTNAEYRNQGLKRPFDNARGRAAAG
jgi:hypothetical protein